MASPGQLTWLLLLVALTSSLCRSSSAAAVCNGVDKQALLTFKSQLINDNKFLDPWKTTTNCCTWPGVTCNAAGRVTVLNLLDSAAFSNADFNAKLTMKPGLTGAGASLGALKASKQIEFRNVVFNFAYPNPKALGSLPALTSLVFIGTQCIGPIPAELGKLTALSILILDGNRFPDGIPDAFGDLVSLISLQQPDEEDRLRAHHVAEEAASIRRQHEPTLRAHPCVVGQAHPQRLHPARAGRVLGPHPGGALQHPRPQAHHRLRHSGDGHPPRTGNCATLIELVLFDNKIAGKLPLELAKLKNLQRIFVRCNQMSGPRPPAISDLPLLREFDVGNNKFSEGIPPNYGPFDEDELSTNFSENQLSGPNPKLLSNLRVAAFRPGNPGLCGAPLSTCK